MPFQMRAEGAMSDKLNIRSREVKPLDVFLINHPSQHTHTLNDFPLWIQKNISLFVKVVIACHAIAKWKEQNLQPNAI